MRQTFDETADPTFGALHLPLIRAQMQRQGLDAFVIPHEDEHQNEYLPEANERLAWATGFTGSAGAAVVTRDAAAVFVDGRYTLQVRSQVDPALFEVRDLVVGGVPAYVESLPAQSVVGYDPRLHSPDALARLKAAANKAGATLQPVQANPIDAAWTDRPPQPLAPVSPHTAEVSGEDAADKRSRVAAEVARAGADAALITAPSSIAWLFNVRGGDVKRSPLPLAQAILRSDGSARLFLDPAKETEALRAWLGNGVTLEPPEALPAALESFAGQRVLVDPGQSSAFYFEALKEAGAAIVAAADPCALPRAAKNAVEIEGARRAHRRDAVPMVRLLHWLATEGQTSPPDEIETVTKLEAFREETGALKDISFDTIAGAGPNGAFPHYHPTTASNRRVQPGELLLVDSGGQYLDGTTDITRTVAIGEPSAEQRDRFTRVLQGHIAIATARFPAGTPGQALDAFARASLWRAGLDYDHGTGHGVGSYLGVHEGPQRIAKASSMTPLLPGMIVSNEPGYYKVGAYGIRIETLVVVTPPEPVPGGDQPMLGFETLTLAPIDRRLVEPSLMTDTERAWLNAYHARVAETVAPELEPPVAAWLVQACAPI